MIKGVNKITNICSTSKVNSKLPTQSRKSNNIKQISILNNWDNLINISFSNRISLSNTNNRTSSSNNNHSININSKLPCNSNYNFSNSKLIRILIPKALLTILKCKIIKIAIIIISIINISIIIISNHIQNNQKYHHPIMQINSKANKTKIT